MGTLYTDKPMGNVGITELMLDESFADWVLTKADDAFTGMTTEEVFRLYKRDIG